MTKRIFRYEVPVDDQWHHIRCGPILHVDCRHPAYVEFWAVPVDDEEDDVEDHRLRVFGTGHEMDAELVYEGTALAPGGFVWHLMCDPWKVAS
jgi:hypothetical protein